MDESSMSHADAVLFIGFLGFKEVRAESRDWSSPHGNHLVVHRTWENADGVRYTVSHAVMSHPNGMVKLDELIIINSGHTVGDPCSAKLTTHEKFLAQHIKEKEGMI